MIIGRKQVTGSAMAVLALAGCKPPPDETHHMPVAKPEQGLKVIAAAGCGSCHQVPGLAWPRGALGPALDGFAERTMIAGKLPNRPDMLAAYVRNAPALVPGAAMPAMPISEEQARDVAAYLYTLESR